MTSAPIRSNASFASMELPHDRCISPPASHRAASRVQDAAVRRAARSSVTAMKNSSRTRAGSARASRRSSRPGTTSPSTRHQAGRPPFSPAAAPVPVAVLDPGRALPAQTFTQNAPRMSYFGLFRRSKSIPSDRARCRRRRDLVPGRPDVGVQRLLPAAVGDHRVERGVDRGTPAVSPFLMPTPYFSSLKPLPTTLTCRCTATARRIRRG